MEHGAGGAGEPRRATVPQHSLRRSVFLHLFPGAALFVFVVAVAPLFGDLSIFALFVGIGVVIVPLELGYLFREARRTTGSWSLAGVVDYRERLPARRLALLTALLAGWFLVVLVVSLALVDQWLADTLFSWLPESIREIAELGEEDDAGDEPGWVVALFVVTALVLNGVVGPGRRGALLPRAPAAADRPARGEGARPERRPLLGLPLLDAVAEPGADPRAPALGLGGLADAERLPLDRGAHDREPDLRAAARRGRARGVSGASGIRTRDLLTASQALSQLSYGPAKWFRQCRSSNR
jgi:hypothetical protein